MCGIAGLWQNYPHLNSTEVMDRMLQAIASRGPDDRGVWHEDQITLGQNRLSILDLTHAGHQPMISASGRYVISYNGEIYNHQNLRKLLPSNLPYKGHSDTETLLTAIEHWGLEIAVEKCVGMFAFALWDRAEKKLYLVRDPIGIKPLYYGWVGNDLVFSSQLKSFKEHPHFKSQVNEESQALYFKYNYIPAPYTVYEKCFKQKPGTILSFDKNKCVEERVYWSLEDAYKEGMQEKQTNDTPILHMEEVLQKSIDQQLIADVPVGVFLSGGVDSSLITALAVKSKPNIQTFSIGFYEERYNEAVYAKRIAQHLGTEHIEEYMPVTQAINLLENIQETSDEPFGDASQLPTFLLSQLTRKHVTVALSGDGGDELFGGYQRYTDLLTLRKIQRCIPRALHALTANTLKLLSYSMRDQKRFKFEVASHAFQKSDIITQYDDIFCFWPHARQHSLAPLKLSDMSDLEYMCYHDAHLYLPDDILTKVDRCSMAVSLETRVPFLDTPVIEQSFRLNEKHKVGNHGTKTILKQILEKYIPRSLTERPKQGFALPIDEWLRGPLKNWAMDLWENIVKDTPVDQNLLVQRMEEHQKGKCNWQYAIWNMLMWQQWKVEQI